MQGKAAKAGWTSPRRAALTQQIALCMSPAWGRGAKAARTASNPSRVRFGYAPSGFSGAGPAFSARAESTKLMGPDPKRL